MSKQMVMPPLEGYPKELRNKSFEITFFIAASGVVSDLKVVPAITNKDFAKKFDQIMRAYTFRPGQDSLGNKVAGVFVYTVTFGGK